MSVTTEERLEARVIRLEEFRARVEKDHADHESRLREIEVSLTKLTGKLAVLAVVGSAVATAVVQWVMKGMG